MYLQRLVKMAFITNLNAQRPTLLTQDRVKIKAPKHKLENYADWIVINLTWSRKEQRYMESNYPGLTLFGYSCSLCSHGPLAEINWKGLHVS
jgi:pyruvate dehydrogenase complex dehydrogenase (E1) component